MDGRESSGLTTTRAGENMEADEAEGQDDGEAVMERFMDDYAPTVGTLTELCANASARLRTLRVVRCGTVRSLDGLSACARLRSVTVAECSLTSLAGARECPGLEELYVYGNEINSLEDMRGSGFERLRTLWVNDNRLLTLDGVEELRALRELNVAGNKLESVRIVDALRELQYLNVAGNPIRSLAHVEVADLVQSLTLRDGVHGACVLCLGNWYRSYTLCALPNLCVLDGQHVSDQERACALEAHTERRLWFNVQCERIREALRRSRSDALEHLMMLSRWMEGELRSARMQSRWRDAENALAKLEDIQITFEMYDARAQNVQEEAIATAFRDAEILYETERERRFAFTDSAKHAPVSFEEIYADFKARSKTEETYERLNPTSLSPAVRELVIATNLVEINLHAVGLMDFPDELRECSRLETLIISCNAISRMTNFPSNDVLLRLDLGNNNLWNSADINLLTTRAKNLTSLIMRGNRKWLKMRKFYAPIVLRKLKNLQLLDGIAITPALIERYCRVEYKLNISAARRKGVIGRGKGNGRSSDIIELCLEGESLRAVDVCESLKSLKVLHLGYNGLRSVKGFAACRRLQHLSIEGNESVRLDGLSLMRELRFLNVRCCGIKRLFPAWFRTLHKLTYINLEGNALDSLSALVSCGELREIYAAHNKISDMSDVVCLAELRGLKLMSLYGNRISVLPKYPHFVIFKCPQLIVFDMEYISSSLRSEAIKMFTGRLTEDMIREGRCESKHDIDLSALNLLHLDHAVTRDRFQNINRINLENNRLTDVSALGSLPRLVKLELQNNRINSSFGRSGYFRKLKFLDLSSNCISSLSVLSLGSCHELSSLFLCDNFLTRLDGISQLKSLSVLKVDKNRLNRVDSNTFDGCSTLRVLSLRRNAFRTLKHLAKLVSVRELRLDENRVSNLEEISWLKFLTRLRVLSLAGNSVALQDTRYFEFVTACCSGLKRLDEKVC